MRGLVVHVEKDDGEREGEQECSICLDEPATCILIPCGHKACCSNEPCKQVVRNHGKCPLCRTPCEGMTDRTLTTARQYSILGWFSAFFPRIGGDPDQGQSGWVLSFIRRLRGEQDEEQVRPQREDNPQHEDQDRNRGRREEEEEEEEEAEVNFCTICLDGIATCILIPCCHPVCCSSFHCKRVVRNHGKCPLCRIDIDGISDLQTRESEVLAIRDDRRDLPSPMPVEPESWCTVTFAIAREELEWFWEKCQTPVFWVRVLFSLIMFFVTPFALVSFLANHGPEGDFQERGSLLLVEGVKYYAMLISFAFLGVAFRNFFIKFTAVASCIVIPWWALQTNESAEIGAKQGFFMAVPFRLLSIGGTFCIWPSYQQESAGASLKALLQGIFVSLPENVFTAWLISLLLVPGEFEDVNNSIRDLCLLAGTMYSPFYCPLLTIVFPDLPNRLVNLTTNKT